MVKAKWILIGGPHDLDVDDCGRPVSTSAAARRERESLHGSASHSAMTTAVITPPNSTKPEGSHGDGSLRDEPACSHDYVKRGARSRLPGHCVKRGLVILYVSHAQPGQQLAARPQPLSCLADIELRLGSSEQCSALREQIPSISVERPVQAQASSMRQRSLHTSRSIGPSRSFSPVPQSPRSCGPIFFHEGSLLVCS